MAKSTPLESVHIKNGGRMVDFAGWNMPVQFEGLRQEHHRVREHVGLFDVSHMGEIRVRGDNALASLEWMTTNFVESLEPGKAQYSLLSNHDGGIVDDIIVYCLEKNSDYLVCVNAANIEKDFQWVLENNKGADITNESESWGQIAVQGPKALALLERVFGDCVANLSSFSFCEAQFNGETCIIARTGYTGENGGEVFVPAAMAEALWLAFEEKGADLEVASIGLGARDTLRTEMKYSLYGQEINDTTNPYEAGLGWVVKAAKKDFLGKDKIVAEKEAGLKRKLIGFKMVERGIPRHGYKVFSFDNQEIGEVTSGTVSPSLNENIGIAYVPVEYASEGSEFFVEVRQRMIKAQVVKTPFYQPGGES